MLRQNTRRTRSQTKSGTPGGSGVYKRPRSHNLVSPDWLASHLKMATQNAQSQTILPEHDSDPTTHKYRTSASVGSIQSDPSTSDRSLDFKIPPISQNISFDRTGDGQPIPGGSRDFRVPPTQNISCESADAPSRYLAIARSLDNPVSSSPLESHGGSVTYPLPPQPQLSYFQHHASQAPSLPTPLLCCSAHNPAVATVILSDARTILANGIHVTLEATIQIIGESLEIAGRRLSRGYRIVNVCAVWRGDLGRRSETGVGATSLRSYWERVKGEVFVEPQDYNKRTLLLDNSLLVWNLMLLEKDSPASYLEYTVVDQQGVVQHEW